MADNWQMVSKQWYGWEQMRKTWWGRGKDASLDPGKVLVFEGDLAKKGKLVSTHGRVYIRDEYKAMFDRVANFCKSDDDKARGIVVTGQPGTGKSYLAYYFLAHKLAGCETIFFCRGTYLYYFAEDTSYRWDLKTAGDIRAEWDVPGKWLLIDFDTVEEPDPKLLDSSLFPILFASSRYKVFEKERRAFRWSMKRWTYEEVRDSLMFCAFSGGYSEDKAVDPNLVNAIRKWGWAPRDIFKVIKDGDEALETDTIQALQAQNIETLVRSISEPSSSTNTHSHLIVSTYLIQRRDRAHDVMTVDFKSIYICNMVQKHLIKLQFADAMRFYNLCRANPRSAILAGWSFESIAIEILCRSVPGIEIPDAETMHRSGSGNKFTWPASSVAEDVPLQSSARPTKKKDSHLSEIHKPTYEAFKIIEFSLESVSLDFICPGKNYLYVLKQPNFPLLDAFFLQHDGDQIVVFSLQMTVAAVYKGSKKGYDFLERLRAHLTTWRQETSLQRERKIPGVDERQLKRGGLNEDADKTPVEFRFILVVPIPQNIADRSPSRKVVWELPNQPSFKVKDPVWVQHIPIEGCPPLSTELIEDQNAELDMYIDEG